MNHPLGNPDIAPIISSIASVLATAILAMIGKAIAGIRSDTKRFMREHLYLLRVADWSKTNLTNIFDHLGLTPTEPPPILPNEAKRNS